MAQIKVKKHGIKRVQEALNNLLKHTDDLTPAFQDIGEYLLLSTDERFDAQISPTGEEWQAVTEDTQEGKKTDKILTESQRLRDSVVYSADKDSVTVGTNVIYSAIHQLGGEIEQKHRTIIIPARPYLGISHADRREILAILQDHLSNF